MLWLKASDLTLADGAAVSFWPDASNASNSAAQPVPGAEPVFSATGFNGLPTVVFDGFNDFLFGPLELQTDKTILAAFRDTGTTTECCSGVGVHFGDVIRLMHCPQMFWTDSDNGLETVLVELDGANNTHLMIDWAGSGNYGATSTFHSIHKLRSGQSIITNQTVVASLMFNASSATLVR